MPQSVEAARFSLRNSPYSRLGAFLAAWVNFDYLEPDIAKRQEMRAAVLDFMQRQRPDDLVRAIRPFLADAGGRSAFTPEEAKRRLRAFITCDITTVAAAVRSMVLVEADRLFLGEAHAVERRRAAHRKLFADPAIHAIVDMWWRALPKDVSGAKIAFDAFASMHSKMTAELRPDVTPEDAAAGARHDWEQEARGGAGLPCAPFVDFLFDVAGSWARSADSHSYCTLLADLYGKVFGGGEAAGSAAAAAAATRAYTPLFGPDGGDPFVPQLGPPANTYHPKPIQPDPDPALPAPLDGVRSPRAIARSRADGPQFRPIPAISSDVPILPRPRGRPRNEMRASHSIAHVHSKSSSQRASVRGGTGLYTLGAETRRRKPDEETGYPLETAILYRLAECIKNGAAPPVQAREVLDMFDAGLLPMWLLSAHFPKGTRPDDLRRFLDQPATAPSPAPAPSAPQLQPLRAPGARSPPPRPKEASPDPPAGPPSGDPALFDRRLDLLLRMHAARNEARKALGKITSRPLPINSRTDAEGSAPQPDELAFGEPPGAQM